jgi:hypothetical protein
LEFDACAVLFLILDKGKFLQNSRIQSGANVHVHPSQFLITPRIGVMTEVAIEISKGAAFAKSSKNLSTRAQKPKKTSARDRTE